MHTRSKNALRRGLARRITMALFGTLLLSAGAAPALAAEVRQGDSVVVGPNETINDDLYAFGSTVTILGTVNGDVFTAGSTITVGGNVSGDVFAAGSTTTINGQVRQSVRAAGGTVTLSGPIGEDALIAGGTANLGPSARVGRDLLAGTGSAYINGPVTRNVLMAGGEVTLAAPVGGNVQAQADTLRLSSGAHIAGGLAYTSERGAEIASGATVGGAIQRTEPQLRQQPTGPFGGPGAAVIDWIRALVGLTALGLVIVFWFPRFTQRTLGVASRSAWASLGLGFALLVGLPILAIIVLVVGAILGGWWLALLLLAAYAVAIVTGYTLAAVFVGHSAIQVLRLSQQHLAWYLVEGLALIGLVALVPFVGGLIVFTATVFGLGALALAVVDAYRARPVAVAAAAVEPIRSGSALTPVTSTP